MIAIIAILASMLLPALSKARDRAKTTNCTNNLKQLYLPIVAYADDYKCLVRNNQQLSHLGNDNNSGYMYVLAYLKYVPSSRIATEGAWGSSDSLDKTIFRCPQIASNATTGKPVYASYALYGAGKRDVAEYRPGRYFAGVKKPSQKVLGGDTCDDYLAGDNYWQFGLTVSSSNGGLYRLAHGGNKFGNFLFCDGHVKAVPGVITVTLWLWANHDSNSFDPEANGTPSYYGVK